MDVEIKLLNTVSLFEMYLTLPVKKLNETRGSFPECETENDRLNSIVLFKCYSMENERIF